MYYLTSNYWVHKYFENGGKSMPFVIKDDDVLDEYNKIWDKVKGKLNKILRHACL